jgi:hypothetical protein
MRRNNDYNLMAIKLAIIVLLSSVLARDSGYSKSQPKKKKGEKCLKNKYALK